MEHGKYTSVTDFIAKYQRKNAVYPNMSWLVTYDYTKCRKNDYEVINLPHKSQEVL